MSKYWEKYYPLVIAIITTILTFYFKLIIDPQKSNIANVLSAIINMSAIIIGFLAAMISVVIAISDSKIMQDIKNFKKSNDLNWYLFFPIILGFIVAIGTTLCFMMQNINCYVVRIISLFWVFFVTLFFASTFRVTSLLYQILKHISTPVNLKDTANKTINVSSDSVNIPSIDNDES